MDHGGGHGGGHSGHSSPGTPSDSCSMSMLFTWDPTNLCVVFRWWHVRTIFDLVATFVAIVALAAGYEYLRFRMRALDSKTNSSLSPTTDSSQRLTKALGYALQVGYSYFMMLIFMTYNGWAWAAVCVGAFTGYWFWGSRSERALSCH